MEQGINIVKKEEDNQIEALLEKPLIKEEKDIPEYININSISKVNVKPEIVKQTFQCVKCPTKFKKMEYLAIHTAIHDPKMSCPVCHELFNCRKKLKIHINYHIKLKINDDRKIMYNCTYCLKSFNAKKKYTIHLRVHTNERPHKCQICGEGFKQLSALKNHYVTHTKERNHVCEVCSGSFSTSSSLKRHKKRIHDTGKTMNCKHCNAKFQNKADFDTHRIEAHPHTCFKKTCRFCSEVFVSKTLYKAHMQLHKDRNTKSLKCYLCKLCGAEVNDKMKYVDHTRQHLCYTQKEMKEAMKSRLFHCKSCTVVYKTKRNLLRHMDHHFKKTIKCDLCQDYTTYLGLRMHKKRVHQILDCHVCHKVLVGRSKLYYHYKKYHPSRAKDYECNICGKKYTTKPMLKYHYNLKHQVNSVKNFKCDICGKRFMTQHVVTRHKKEVHSFKVKFNCSKCDLTFKTHKAITMHKSKHETPDKNGELSIKKVSVKITKQSQCKVCKKIFRCPSNYKSHVSRKTCIHFFTRKHRLHTCEFCEKSFLTGTHLKRHLQFHSDYDYQCYFCDRKFKIIESIRKHMKMYHADKQVYWCEYCGKGFDVLSDYETHSSVHTMKIEIEESILEGVNSSEIKKETTDS